MEVIKIDNGYYIRRKKEIFAMKKKKISPRLQMFILLSPLYYVIKNFFQQSFLFFAFLVAHIELLLNPKNVDTFRNLVE